MALRIDFEGKVNKGVQIGDSAWIADIDTNTFITTSTPLFVGVIIDILISSIVVEVDGSFTGTITTSSFLMFSKAIEVEKSSVQGYYADITLENKSNKAAELFAISSEVTPSSK